MSDMPDGAWLEYFKGGPEEDDGSVGHGITDPDAPLGWQCGDPACLDHGLSWFGPSTPPMSTAKPRKCRRHEWVAVYVEPEPYPRGARCARCGKERDETSVRRGRTNRQRGNAIEREVGKRLGLRRVGQYGGPDDLSNALFAAQVKSGGAFPERFWRWLKAVPVNAGQTALLVVTDAPGPGHRRRAVVVLDIDDWIALHGSEEQAA